MRKLIFVGVLMLAMSGLALAQDFPKFEVFGGYSYLRSDLNFDSPWMEDYYYYNQSTGTGNLNGFEAAFTYNLNSWLGIKADFSGPFGEHKMDRSDYYDQIQYDDNDGGEAYYHTTNEYEQKGKADVRRYTYLFGPEFSYRGNDRVRPFAHALLGVSKADVKDMNVDWTRQYLQESYNSSDYAYLYTGNVSGSFSNTSFAMALGAGLDVNVNEKFAIRLAQIDYMPTFHELKGNLVEEETRYNGTTLDDVTFDWSETYEHKVTIPSQRYNNLRLSAGVVFKF